MNLSEQQILHKKIIYTFVFGVIWGLIEILLNSLFSSANLYLRGIIFSVFVVFILIFAKRFIDYKFSLLIIAAIALIIKSAASGILDRKSTRLNSSHVKISYAVFCLK